MIYIYVNDSSTAPYLNGTPLNPIIVRTMQKAMIRYPIITYGFRYSFITESFFFSALFFNRICEKEDNIPDMIMIT